MAKTTAPALSFQAKGSIAKTMVFSRWRGVDYVRQHVIPSNPRTVAQQTVRLTFALLREMFKLGGSVLRAPWDAHAQGRPFTGMNKFVGENVRVLNGETTMDNFIGSPGAKGGMPPGGITVTSPNAGEILVEVDLPDLPDGWTQSAVAAFAFRQQPPNVFFEGSIIEGIEEGEAADSVTLTGAEPGQDYVVAAYLRQEKPDGTYAYSVSLTDEIEVSNA